MSGLPEGAWARGRGVTLVALQPSEALAPGLQQALRDGLERGYEGDTPALPADARAYRIEVRGESVGVLAVRTSWPAPSEATIVAVAVDPAHRGRSAAMRALLLAEHALAEEGVARIFAIVPRTNGRGLYFMLRCGYAPVLGRRPPEASLDVTWFARRDGRNEARGA
ncbi:MAG: GNAT family N-acetyltransferase [Dehalococcoidia bacterium]|nr:GNAT family N-acetyltransferase [Dehalococcoidia bacterium]